MTPAARIAAARQELLAARAEVEAYLATHRDRSRGPHVRMLHEISGMLDPAYPYVSQAAQDRIVDTLLGGKTGGVFVDIGAYDGVTGSNSLYFERWRDWTGVLVEPVADMRARAQTVRRAPCLPYAAAAAEGEAEFIAVTHGFTQMSGLADHYDPGLLDRVRADPRHAERRVTVQTRTIAAILDEAGIAAPDFVSLDIEGGELAALRAFPFARYRVGCWAIENNTSDPQIARLMRENGYDLVEFCGPDEIYRLKAT